MKRKQTNTVNHAIRALFAIFPASFPLIFVAAQATALFIPMPLAAKDEKFALPLRVAPTGAHKLIRLDFDYADGRKEDTYARRRVLGLEAEYAFGNFSLGTIVDYGLYERTGTAPERERGRWNLALKYVGVSGGSNSRFAFGGGLRIFDKLGHAPREDEDPDLNIVRPWLTIGFGGGAHELVAELRFQSETNARLREEKDEEFRRHWQIGLSYSVGLTSFLRLFLETEYREPYNPGIDVNSRFWNLYPGVSISTPIGTFGVSGLYGMKKEWPEDRGLRISYYLVFD